MELFALYFNLLLFYIELTFGFWITQILKKENPYIESFSPTVDMVLNNIYIYIYIYIYWIGVWVNRVSIPTPGS